MVRDFLWKLRLTIRLKINKFLGSKAKVSKNPTIQRQNINVFSVKQKGHKSPSEVSFAISLSFRSNLHLQSARFSQCKVDRERSSLLKTALLCKNDPDVDQTGSSSQQLWFSNPNVHFEDSTEADGTAAAHRKPDRQKIVVFAVSVEDDCHFIFTWGLKAARQHAQRGLNN